MIITTFLFACVGVQSPAINTPEVFVTFTSAPLKIAATPTSFQPSVTMGAAVPPALRELVKSSNISSDLKSFDVSLNQYPGSNPDEILFHWVYVLVAPFPTVREGVTFDELHSTWSIGPDSSVFSGKPLLMDESTLAAFTAIWGAPASGAVRSVSNDLLLDTAWNESSWAIIPFESLSPKWKVLMIDDQSPIHKDFDETNYPLVIDFTLQESQPQPVSVPKTNYDLKKLTTVVITGTTALVRATAFRMEKKGITYPGQAVRDILRSADIAHVSNEVSFFTGCPFPDPNSGRLVFCSDPKYMGLLTDVGVDVVELTGNHFADYGRGAMNETLSMYKANNIQHFGGGDNLQDALQPALFEINGNKIAFLGCNLPDIGTLDIARPDRPGAAPCDFDYFTSKVAELKAQGYLVIFTFQWNEDYVPQPEKAQVHDFRRMVDAGAAVVSGSQAHFPKTMEFYQDSFIHYGLGNLFFDQMGNFDWMPTGIRREFLDRYAIYDGKLIGVELITTLLEDFARPRLMTPTERAEFLQEYFADSGWTPIVDASVPVAPAGTSVP